MVVFRSFKALIRDPKRSRTFLTASSATTSTIPLPYFPLTRSLSHPLFRFPSSNPSRFLSPFCKWVAPLHGPLFLSCPPWMLSQSATPLYLQGNAVVLRRVQALNLNLNLLRSRTAFPLKLGLGSVSSGQTLLNRVETPRQPTDTFVKSFVNLPNLISMSRLLSGPVLGWMITNEWYSSAMLGLAISGATDWLDGYVARKMRINSVMGSYLDPLADKVLIGCVALAMVHNDLLHSGLVGLIVLRDVFLIGGAVYERASSLGWEWKTAFEFFNLDGTCPQKVEPLFISKVNTVLQLALVAAALVQPQFGTQETQLYIEYLSWLVASTTVASTAAYGVKHMQKRSAMIGLGYLSTGLAALENRKMK